MRGHRARLAIWFEQYMCSAEGKNERAVWRARRVWLPMTPAEGEVAHAPHSALLSCYEAFIHFILTRKWVKAHQGERVRPSEEQGPCSRTRRHRSCSFSTFYTRTSAAVGLQGKLGLKSGSALSLHSSHPSSHFLPHVIYGGSPKRRLNKCN